MSLLAYSQLCQLIARGIVAGSDIEMVNTTSIDIRLGDAIMVEKSGEGGGIGGPPSIRREVSLRNRDHLSMEKIYLNSEGYAIRPGEFILAQSLETFHLPNDISAEYKLKSSMARLGLEHLNAGWCDSGWSGSVLTLELKNMTQYHSIRIRPGDRIGQMVFFEHVPVPADRSYSVRGRYNNDTEVMGVKV
jgi:dCTP deaminase